MSKPGKWESHQQLRAKLNAEKEAPKIVSKPLKEEPKPIVLGKVEVPVEVELEVTNEIVEEIQEPQENPNPDFIQQLIQEEKVEEIKPELKPISKKNKTKA